MVLPVFGIVSPSSSFSGSSLFDLQWAQTVGEAVGAGLEFSIHGLVVGDDFAIYDPFQQGVDRA